MLEFAKNHGIIIFCLPPHTTHVCQPLDCSLFKSLKSQWKTECHYFYQKNPSLVISKFNFCTIFRDAWLKAITPYNIVAGFRKAGVFPLNREKILLLAETQSEYSVCVRLFMCICFLGFDVTKSSKSISSHDSCSLANSCDNDASGTELVGNTGSVSDHSFKAAGENSEFTVAEELKYAQRYEELPDPHYEEWLRQNHPEVAIRSTSCNCTPPTPNLLTSHLTFEAGTVSPVQVSDPPLISFYN